jgi:cyclic beta-1,2-glucan synthetase
VRGDLTYVTARYVAEAGDASVLDELVPFLEQPALEPGQHETYMQPRLSPESASLFEHCVRAIAYSMKYGSHGLPLIGTGDWNDGMNRVGHEGRGESVWLGWFLVTVLNDFAPLCDRRCVVELAQRYRDEALVERDAGTGLGRRLVPARLFRRRDATRIGAKRGVQARLADTVVGSDLRRGVAQER